MKNDIAIMSYVPVCTYSILSHIATQPKCEVQKLPSTVRKTLDTLLHDL